MLTTPQSLSGVFDTLADISRRVVMETYELRYGTASSSGLDMERKASTQIPHGERIDLLEGLRFGRTPDPDTVGRLSKYGAPAEHEDVRGHQLVVAEVRRLLGDVISIVAGEEASTEEWDNLLNLPADALGLVADPVDGTTNARAMRLGFSCNLGLYRSLGEGRFLHLGSTSTNSGHETLIYDARGGVPHMVSPAGSVIMLGQSRGDARSWNESGTYASVAGRGDARAELAAILDPAASFDRDPATYGGVIHYDPAIHVFNVGGAPAMVSFPLSGVEYIHVPHDQTPYDAFPLAGVLAAGGCTYYSAETLKPVGLFEVMDWLSILTGPDGDQPRPVKEGLLVRHGAKPETTAKLLAAVHEVWRQRQQSQLGSVDSNEQV